MVNLDYYACTGFALELLAQSPYHQNQQMGDYFNTEILPALWVNQARFYLTEEGSPTAMVTWAWLSKGVEQDILTTGRALDYGEWQSGDRLFFNDWITPYNNIRAVVKDMTTRVFPNEAATSIRRNPDGSIRKINRWTGIALRQQPLKQEPEKHRK